MGDEWYHDPDGPEWRRRARELGEDAYKRFGQDYLEVIFPLGLGRLTWKQIAEGLEHALKEKGGER